jgi:teichuronic acid biosynthesis glycosyltransferase TuaC
VRILTFTTLYPSALQPQHGIFVETRLRKLVATGAVDARVVAPCPWFPLASARFGRYAAFAGTPSKETLFELRVDHPRYPALPKIGMTTAPVALFLAILPLLRRQIREGWDFDLIDAHYFYPDGVAAVLLGRALDRPVIVTARGSDLNIVAQYAIPRRWISWAARRADGLIAVSNGLKQRLIELGIGAERVRVLRNGVDLALFRPYEHEAARRALGFMRPTLLAVGNLVALKRHELMIEALAQLPEVELVIVGEGPERAAIERLTRERRVGDRVQLLGRLPQDRLPLIYSAADLLLLTSSHEGWPNVLLESMACGTPVVVSDIGGIADIVGAPEAGRILADTTPGWLAAAIRDLLAAPPSRAATRLYAEQFGWQSTTEGQIALFRQVLERRPGEHPLAYMRPSAARCRDRPRGNGRRSLPKSARCR